MTKGCRIPRTAQRKRPTRTTQAQKAASRAWGLRRNGGASAGQGSWGVGGPPPLPAAGDGSPGRTSRIRDTEMPSLALYHPVPAGSNWPRGSSVPRERPRALEYSRVLWRPATPSRRMTRKTPGRLSGKVAVVTGGASGMGRAGAALMAAEGARVVVADVEVGRAREVVRAI